MKQTEHFGLNQWDPTDRILREDFNRDNKTIDAALAGLGAAAAGRGMERIYLTESEGTISGSSYGFGGINWDEWDCVAHLISVPGKKVGDSPTLSLMIYTKGGNNPTIENLTQPGLLAVFLPMKDGNSKVSGFVASSGRFVPFFYDFTYKEMSNVAVFVEGTPKISIPTPIAAFCGIK